MTGPAVILLMRTAFFQIDAIDLAVVVIVLGFWED